MKTLGIAIFIVVFLTFNINPSVSLANEPYLRLPSPGVLVSLSPSFKPMLLRGMKPDPNDFFRFEFIVDSGDEGINTEQNESLLMGQQATSKHDEMTRQIKYFLAALTMPESDMWVNLSPYEKGLIIPETFSQTVLGRDLLAQDYLLKQISASLMHPDNEIGKRFWEKIYQQAKVKFGSTQIPVDTINKVWIMPEVAKVYEDGQKVLIVDSRLKVLMQEDYLAQQKSSHAQLDDVARIEPASISLPNRQKDKQWQKQIIQELIISELEKEVNEGANFAVVRQAYHALILSVWFKKNLKKSLLGQKYMNQGKVKGVDIANGRDQTDEIYHKYIQAYKKGVANVIREEIDPATGQMIPRKYFTGGIPFVLKDLAMATKEEALKTNLGRAVLVSVAFADLAMASNSPEKEKLRASINETLRSFFMNQMTFMIETRLRSEEIASLPIYQLRKEQSMRSMHFQMNALLRVLNDSYFGDQDIIVRVQEQGHDREYVLKKSFRQLAMRFPISSKFVKDDNPVLRRLIIERHQESQEAEATQDEVLQQARYAQLADSYEDGSQEFFEQQIYDTDLTEDSKRMLADLRAVIRPQQQYSLEWIKGDPADEYALDIVLTGFDTEPLFKGEGIIDKVSIIVNGDIFAESSANWMPSPDSAMSVNEAIMPTMRDLLPLVGFENNAPKPNTIREINTGDSVRRQELGGIDFNPANVNLQTALKGSNQAMSFNMIPKQWEDIEIKGLSPIIVSVRPVEIGGFLE